jgi:aminoglycoside N3'-acetyltransferase
MLKNYIKQAISEETLLRLIKVKKTFRKASKNFLPALTEQAFKDILFSKLKLKTGGVIFVHSSIDGLNLSFEFYNIISLLRNVIGEEGTILFPTYPKKNSYDFLIGGEIFDVQKTSSYSGVLTELARRHKGSIRSLHPTKSVCAIGSIAQQLTDTHQNSPYPYDNVSPYHKVMDFDGKIIGLGVSTQYISFIHCVDDALKDDFPVNPYHRNLFDARCIDYQRRTITVKTYAHDIKKMNFDIPRFMKKYIPKEVCFDIKIHGMNFFYADAKSLYNLMIELALKGITIYPKSSYTKG